MKMKLKDAYLTDVLEYRYMETANYSFLRDIDTALSPQRLEQIQSRGDLPRARDIDDNDNRYYYYRSHLEELEKQVADEVGFKVRSSGYFWYPYGGFCGWHTNSNREGERIYLVWAQDEGKSFFRYQDRDSKEIVTNWDKKGWQIKRFKITLENPIWHCVGSYTNRISIGFNACAPED